MGSLCRPSPRLKVSKKNGKLPPLRLWFLTAQYTTEEYQALKDFFEGIPFYHWESSGKETKDFDGLLLRGDRNPNRAGLREVFPEIKPLKELEQAPEMIFYRGAGKSGVFCGFGGKNSLFYPFPEGGLDGSRPQCFFAF